MHLDVSPSLFSSGRRRDLFVLLRFGGARNTSNELPRIRAARSARAGKIRSGIACQGEPFRDCQRHSGLSLAGVSLISIT